MFTDQMGETSGAWQRAVYNYGTEDPAYVMSVPILQNALPRSRPTDNRRWLSLSAKRQ